jgi:hypothetical protein
VNGYPEIGSRIKSEARIKNTFFIDEITAPGRGMKNLI